MKQEPTEETEGESGKMFSLHLEERIHQSVKPVHPGPASPNAFVSHSVSSVGSCSKECFRLRRISTMPERASVA